MRHNRHLQIKSYLAYALTLVCILTVGMGLTNTYAAPLTATSDEGTFSASMDSSYVYLSYTGAWNYNIQETITVGVNGSPVSGRYGSIVLNTGNQVEQQELVVCDSWYGEIPGASGTAVNTGSNRVPYQTVSWKIQVPLSTYGGAIDSLDLNWRGQSLSLTADTAEDTTEATTEDASATTETSDSSEPSTASPSTEDTSTYSPSDSSTEVGVTSKIVIDGYYDDWTAYPSTDITYFSNNSKSVHKGQIYTDGEMVYVHFAMNDLYGSQIQVHQMSITINGETHSISVLPVTPDHQIDWAYNSTINNGLPNGTYTNLGVIVDYTKYCDSQAALTIYDSTHQPTTKGDEIEFAFRLADFARITGMNTDHIESITISNPNIGGQDVTWAGTSTGPILGVIAAIVICGAGFYTWKKKKGNAQ